MSKRTQSDSRGQRNGVWLAVCCATCALTLALVACRSGPPPALYVLGDSNGSNATGALPTAVVTETNVPVLEVHRVLVPAYLDTTDIVTRSGSELVRRKGSRWAERLSTGMTRALAAALGARLPSLTVTTLPPFGPAKLHVFVNIVAFEGQRDGQVILKASWSIVDGAQRELLAQSSVFAQTVASPTDNALVAAMDQSLDALADDLAGAVKSTLARS